jgi:hypothetical protein
MPTFTINRIVPIVEMLNFYATANNPRWQAIGTDGGDSDLAAVFSDIADYIWYNSDGSTIYANAINDAVTKSMGYLMITVDPDADNGMGEVVIQQPDPFDVFVDEKSRDVLFRDAGYVMIRKTIPKNHLLKMFPGEARKIKKAASVDQMNKGYSEKSTGVDQKDFHYKDLATKAYLTDAEQDEIGEYFEVYEKIKVEYINLFYQNPPNEAQMKEMQQQVEVRIQALSQQLEVELKESMQALQMQLQNGEIIQERFNLEAQRLQQGIQQKLAQAQQEAQDTMMSEQSKIENKVITEAEFKILMEDKDFQKSVVNAIPFYATRIKQTCVVGDQLLYEKYLPDKITEYPIVPIHFKWTGTPYPISAVSPLIGKQREINKSHQIMVHNASLGSSLRWVHEEGAIDLDLWQRYSSAPGALLPIRPGAAPPTAVQPAPLSNAFFQVVQEGKVDMEYLAGIYSSMQGDTGTQHETYRGMMALDEYGTRRVKGWLKNSIEPALKQIGLLVAQFSQAVYTANKKFRIVQPNELQESKEVEINIPMFNDMGEHIGKSMDWSNFKYDIRIVSGSTLPVNRWAYLSELKELMQLGVVDDLAVLAETDLRNKKKIAERKSYYSQLQGQLSSMEEAIKDKDGTIETLERQLVQAGIKGKIQDAEMEITKKKEQVKASMDKAYNTTDAKQKALQAGMKADATVQQEKYRGAVEDAINDMQSSAQDRNNTIDAAVEVAKQKMNMAVDNRIKNLEKTEKDE